MIGDSLVIKAEDVVVEDAKLIDAHQLEVDESTLTGESLPVIKTTEYRYGNSCRITPFKSQLNVHQPLSFHPLDRKYQGFPLILYA